MKHAHPRRPLTRRSIPCSARAIFVAAAFAIPLTNWSADFFSEDFSQAALATPLIVPNRYATGPNATPTGSLQDSQFNTFRDFVRTSATDYNTVDFNMEITVTVGGSNPSQTAFVGIGSAIPDPNYFTEPHTAVYMRLFPDDFLDGSLGLTVTPNDMAHYESIVSHAPHPGAGTHRIQIRKEANLLTFSADIDYTGLTFVADYSVTKHLDSELSFLNSGNSRLFFGVQGPSTTFDDLRIERIQVPDQGIGLPGAGLTLAALLLGARRWQTR